MDAERRRIEEAILDGPHTRLVVLAGELDQIDGALGPDLAALVAGTAEELADLARGIHPSALAEQGLVGAVTDRAGRLPVPVGITHDPELAHTRLGADVAAAAYFAVSEALTNIVKHADAATATIDLRLHDGTLEVEIADDGRGFVADPTARGSGLTGLHDRALALGGLTEVATNLGMGTRVRLVLPVAGPD